MKRMQTLLDLASDKCGNDSALGRQIDKTPQQVNDMRTGRLTITPETAALLCGVLRMPGDEAREWVALALIEQPKNASRAAALRRALFRVIRRLRPGASRWDGEERRAQ